MPEEIIRLERATVAFQETVGRQDISFALSRGEFVGIVGPNGSGKTTLLKLLLGLVKPASGSVFVLGATGRGLVRVRRRIGYVPQRRPIDPRFPISVFEAVLMGCYGTLGVLKQPSGEDRRRVLTALAEVGLENLVRHVAGHLSGGQQQRLLLARALVQEPEILLLDEPTAGVDVAARRQIVDLIQRVHQTRQLTTLYVTHDLNEIINCLGRVMFLNRTLRAFGSWQEVVNPETLADLYGVPVVVLERDGRPFVGTGDYHG